ncbi:hypothetical protein HY632_01110 [Candidatus Uhrbacteria bacterium]|nr:hypothetical protein [Candidatus Uhrbacteria bacterium]
MRCTIDHLEDDHAMLRTEQGHLIAVPLAELPTPVTVGDTVYAHFSSEDVPPDARTAQARAVLNELLSTNQ